MESRIIKEINNIINNDNLSEQDFNNKVNEICSKFGTETVATIWTNLIFGA